MSDNEDAQADLQRRFEAVISGTELADLRALTGDLLAMGRTLGRPELRRRRRAETAIFRVRIDLDGAAPPIWRRLDLRSDLPLDVVHQILQVAFDWTDSHLHRFSLGGHPFDRDSQVFLCSYDAEEREDGDEDALPAAEVTLDETLGECGDTLHYLYDYGDSWELTLRLEEVRPAEADAGWVTAVDGRRASPPEDSGGVADAESLAVVLSDPARFDLAELTRALGTAPFALRARGLAPMLIELVDRLGFTAVGDDLLERLNVLVAEPTEPGPEERAAALAAHQWFLDRAADGGIALTAAGYLKPADVEAASPVVPTMAGWGGKHNRENQSGPLLAFRQSLQGSGLLRKQKGVLKLTRAGASARRDPGALWRHLADRLIVGKWGDYEHTATLLLLAYAGSSEGAELPLDKAAGALSELGWCLADGSPVQGHHFSRLRVLDILQNVTAQPIDPFARLRISPAAAALARAALRKPDIAT